MRQDGDWGGHLELVAAARMYRYVEETLAFVQKITLSRPGPIYSMICSRKHYFARSRDITVYSANLDAFTIEHGFDKAAGPDLLLCYHDNDHYNSVRISSGSKPPPPIKTYVAPHPPPTQTLDPFTHEDEASEMILEETTSATNTSAGSCETSSDVIPDVEMSEKASPLPPSERTKKSSPCPCGSGLRFKKCCAAKGKPAATANVLPQQVPESSAANASSSNGEEEVEPSIDGTFRVFHI